MIIHRKPVFVSSRNLIHANYISRAVARERRGGGRQCAKLGFFFTGRGAVALYNLM